MTANPADFGADARFEHPGAPAPLVGAQKPPDGDAVEHAGEHDGAAETLLAAETGAVKHAASRKQAQTQPQETGKSRTSGNRHTDATTPQRTRAGTPPPPTPTGIPPHHPAAHPVLTTTAQP